MEKKYKDYLDHLRESGVVNMFGTQRILMAAFGLSRREATKVFFEWIDGFEKEGEDSHNQIIL
jgi:hypothetical protein